MGVQIRESRSGENFKPMSSLDLFFGLGTDTEVDSVIVRWPSGQVDVVVSPAINTRISILEGLLPAVIRLTKVNPYSQEITIKNFGGEPADISGYRLCSEFSCTNNLSDLTIVNGDFNLGTGEEVTVAWTTGSGFSISGADMSLFLPTGNLGNPAVMEDFTQWGSGGNGSEFVAVAKGIWGAGDFVPLGFEYTYTGSGFQDGVSFWQESEFCPIPSDGIASNLSTTGADLSWIENGSATSWDLEIGLADFSPTGTPTASGVTIPYAFSGTEGTVYDFYVRSNCAASGGIGLSDWAGPFRFTIPLPVSFCDVAIDVSVGGTFNTGFIDGIYEDFESCMGSNPTNANWFVYSATVPGTLNISSVGIGGVDTEVSVGVGTCGNLTEIACDDDFTGSFPYESEVEFEVTAGTDYYIMWGDGWTPNASDFTVTFEPDFICAEPSELQASNFSSTGADITWTENGTATSWDLEIGSAGFTPSGVPTNSSNAATYALTGAEGESLDIYVRSDCGLGGFSAWVGPLSVTLVTSYPGNQWLDFGDATPARLTVTSVANSDSEEKDIAVADLNNDGFDDVIVCRKEPFSLNSEGTKSDLLLMNEDGVLTDRTTLYAPEFITSETFARDLYIGDFDGDGWKDVIVANTFGQQPRYYANQGNDGGGNWLGLVDESSTRFPTLTGADILRICGVTGGDVDGDNDQDIYFVSYKQTSGQGIAQDYLLINDGNGVFTDESDARLGTLRNSAFGTSVQIYDMDNDGDDDILKVSTLFPVLPWGDVGLFVLFNEGAGTFSNWQNIASDAPYTFEVADFNADGLLDVFVVNDGADYLLTVNSVVADNSLNFTTTNVVNGLSGFGGNVHAVDLDLDGDLDIAVSDVVVDVPPCDSERRLALLENQGGVFVDHHTTDVREWEVNSYDLGFADINGDGLQDIITGGCSGYNVFMSDNCALVTGSADFDLDGLADACDACPTNPDPNCEPDVNFPTVSTDGSIARQWNDLLLASIRKDFARPTVHARNLFHTSMGMWDAWAVYDQDACTYLLGKTVDGFSCDYDPVPLPNDIPAARDEAMSYMAYRLLSHRFAASTNAALLQMAYNAHMDTLGYDINMTSTDYSSGDPAAMGNYIAQCIISFGLQDGSNEQNGYVNQRYEPVNPPMIVKVPGNSQLEDWNRWQPLSLDLFIDQSGNQIPGSTPEFLSPEWGQVSPFALDEADKVTFNRDNFDYEVYHDPGTPPLMDTTGVLDSEDYRWNFMTTMLWSSQLDPTDGVMWDISPASIGKRDELPATVADYPDFYDQMNGGTTSPGHAVNPSTGMPYAPNMVPRADYARVLAEFWADGPDSETPPGHWFTLLNYVSDHPELEKKFMGEGPVLDDLEWDVKSYFMMGGAMHDAAVSTWGIKGWHDYLRPISAIRAMAGKGQSTNPGGPSYHPAGVPLIPDYIEVIEVGDPLAGANDEFVGDIKIKAWRGHSAINNVDVDEAGVGWIHASEWEPYQRPSFVTPPFAGYISGHSTFSRAAAEVMTSLTGDAYFPGGLGTFTAEQDEFLVFEDGPSVTVELQWATYQDAADESGLSRIWGGIHPPVDDIPGRKNGIIIGQDAFTKAVSYFGCSAPEPCEDPFPAVSEASLSTIQFSNVFTTLWDPVPGQIGCQIQVRYAGGSILGAKIVGGQNASTFNIPFSVLQPSTSYQWRVRCGCSQTPLVAGPFSSWQQFT
ncbi:MAG: FG-GAP-like repeat-containing protein, partial [Cryomorphaceae bacterium]